MKDIHGERPAPGRIPVLSPTLHCVAMTGLVYLRSSFGFTLFRPRTIFFAFSVAVGVLDYIAWNEPDLWTDYRAACIFGGGAVALYWFHFAITFVRELYQKSERDDFSGTSHASRVLKLLGIAGPATEMNVHIWLEPAIVLIFAAILRFALTEPHLSTWLVIVAVCMFSAEGLNYWTKIRREKIAQDITDDAEDRRQELGGHRPPPEAPKPARVAKQHVKRTVILTEEEAKAKRFAEVLGITEPYDLDEAEANYHDRIRQQHPDTHENTPESNRDTAELNEAIEFFRRTRES